MKLVDTTSYAQPGALGRRGGGGSEIGHPDTSPRAVSRAKLQRVSGGKLQPNFGVGLSRRRVRRIHPQGGRVYVTRLFTPSWSATRGRKQEGRTRALRSECSPASTARLVRPYGSSC